MVALHTNNSTVCSTVCSGEHQRKHQTLDILFKACILIPSVHKEPRQGTGHNDQDIFNREHFPRFSKTRILRGICSLGISECSVKHSLERYAGWQEVLSMEKDIKIFNNMMSLACLKNDST